MRQHSDYIEMNHDLNQLAQTAVLQLKLLKELVELNRNLISNYYESLGKINLMLDVINGLSIEPSKPINK